MKISEIVLLSEDRAINFEISDSELPSFTDPEKSKKLGTFDSYEIIGERYSKDIDAYGIIDKDKPVAVVYLDTVERIYDGKKCQAIIKLWVSSPYRGKGMIMSILGFIIRKTRTPLISGRTVTKNGEDLFKKIISQKTFDVVVYDEKTKQNLDHIPADLFSLPNSYQIIFEQEIVDRQNSEMFEGRLKHYWFFRDGNWD
jgi:hypothetical protein